MIDYRHGIGEEIVKSTEDFRGEVRRPYSSLALDSAEERKVLHFVIIFKNLFVTGEHTTYSTGSCVGGDSIVDSIIHGHRVGHFSGQTSFQVDMPVNDGEILLLEPDSSVGSLVNRWQGVGRIDGINAKTLNFHVSETDVSLPSGDTDYAAAKTHLLVLGKPPWLFRLSVTYHIHSLYLDRDILASYGYLQRSPLSIFSEGTVKVADMEKRTALDGSVDRTSVEKNLVTASGTIIMEGHRGLGTFICKEFSLISLVWPSPREKSWTPQDAAKIRVMITARLGNRAWKRVLFLISVVIISF